VALGYDDGTIMIKLGHEEPVASMDKAGKVVWAKNHEVPDHNHPSYSCTSAFTDALHLSHRPCSGLDRQHQGHREGPSAR